MPEKKMSSFNELKKHVDEQKEELREANKVRLENMDFDAIKTGLRESSLNDVESVNVVSSGESGASVYVEFSAGGNQTFTVTNKGISGRVPGRVEMEKVKLEKAILDALEGGE